MMKIKKHFKFEIIFLFIFFIFAFESTVYSMSDDSYKTNLRVPIGISKNRLHDLKGETELVEQAKKVVDKIIPSSKIQRINQAGAVVFHPSGKEFALVFKQLNIDRAVCVTPIYFNTNKSGIGRNIDIAIAKIVARYEGHTEGLVVPFVIVNKLEGSKHADPGSMAGLLRAQRRYSLPILFVTIFSDRDDFKYFLTRKNKGSDSSLNLAPGNNQYYTEFLKFAPLDEATDEAIAEAIGKNANIFDFSLGNSASVRDMMPKKAINHGV